MRFEDIRVDSRAIRLAERLLEMCGAEVEVMDANETAHFARELEFVKAQTYDIEFGKLKSLNFIPLDTSAPAGTKSITYRQWTEVEAAKVISNYADDLPQVAVFATEFTSRVITVGSSYMWTIEDVERSEMAGSQFDIRLARAARMSIDRRIDEIGAFGEVSVGTTGFVNNANVPINVLPNAGAWAGLSSDFLLENLNDMAQAVVDQTIEVEEANTIILPTAEYGIVAQRIMGGGNGTDTVLTVFLRNSPYITAVEQWSKLNTAGAGSVPRAVAYDRSDRVLVFNIPLLFMQMPPQARNLAFIVPVRARVGVVEWHYPFAAVYSDIS